MPPTLPIVLHGTLKALWFCPSTYHQANKYLFVIYLATSDAQPDSKKSIPQAVIDKAQRASDRVRRKLGLKHHHI